LVRNLSVYLEVHQLSEMQVALSHLLHLLPSVQWLNPLVLVVPLRRL
jgi:hypothetical protein